MEDIAPAEPRPSEQQTEWIVVADLPSETPTEFRDFLVEKFTKSTVNGGLGLLCEIMTIGEQEKLMLSISMDRAARIADETKIMKECIDESMQLFDCSNISQFKQTDGAVLNRSECQRLIFVALEHYWIVDTDDFNLPGYPDVKLDKGNHIVSMCEHLEMISQIYPLHNDELEKLKHDICSWKYLFSPLPLGGIRDYFGESISMYFSFLEFYSHSLIIPSIFGIIYSFSDLNSVNPLILLAFFNLIWSTAFVESWKRRSNTLAYRWGTWDMKFTEITRPSYYGEMGTNPVTGKQEPYYPKQNRLVQMYCVSLPIVLACLTACTLVMLAYCKLEEYRTEWFKTFEEPQLWHPVVGLIPTIIYSIVIIVMNKLYTPLAVKLTDKENHRLQTSYDNQLTVKLVLFWFVNTFLLMFYVAFILKDLHMLRRFMLTALVVTQAADQIQETLLPYFMYTRKLNKYSSNGVMSENGHMNDLQKQSCKEQYEGTFDDFLELFIQFGYVTLFSCVFPLAALLALLNNIVEMRTDAAKLCYVYQKPFSKLTNGIGVWQIVFELMSYIAIVTNTALIGLMLHQSNMLPKYTTLDIVFLAITLEHVLIVIRATVAFLIPDEDRAVRLAKAKDHYLKQTKYSTSHPHKD